MTQQGEQRKEIKFSFELSPKLYAIMDEFARMKGQSRERYCENFMLWGTESSIPTEDIPKWNDERGINKEVTFRIVADVKLEVSKAQEKCLEYAAKEMRCSSVEESVESLITGGPQFDIDNFGIHFEDWVEKFRERVDEAYGRL